MAAHVPLDGLVDRRTVVCRQPGATGSTRGWVGPMGAGDMDAAATSARRLRQVTALTRWAGSGHKLTQTGQLTMADARHLVGLLDTGDQIDPTIGERVFHTRSSADLSGLTTVLAWARATGLVRVIGGRLVAVKKNQRLLEQPTALWAVMFAAFDRLAPVICPSGWYASLLGDDFAEGIAALFDTIAEGGGTAHTDHVRQQVWSTMAARYRLNDATDEQIRHLRASTDRDLGHAIGELVALGALAEDEADRQMLRLTMLARHTLRARYGLAAGDRVAQIKVTLLDTEPPVWRRLLVPATLRLDRLDRVIQAAMGWTNSHLHMFVHSTGHYGIPDLDGPPMHDERAATLRELADREDDAFGYEYDFGDGWEHEIRLEKLTLAEPGGRYPRCLAGARACPPEDCGGAPGYAELIGTLADPDSPEHHDMLRWLGLEKGTDFDPAHFDPADANRRLDAVVLASSRTG